MTQSFQSANELASLCVTGHTASQAACGHAPAVCTASAHAVSDGTTSSKQPATLTSTTPDQFTSGPQVASVAFELRQRAHAAFAVWKAKHAAGVEVVASKHAAS